MSLLMMTGNFLDYTQITPATPLTAGRVRSAPLNSSAGASGTGIRSASAPEGLEAAGGTTEPPALAPADRTPVPLARRRAALRSAAQVAAHRAAPQRSSASPRLRCAPQCSGAGSVPLRAERSGAEVERARGRGPGSSSAGAEAGGSVVPPAASNPSGAEAEELPGPAAARREPSVARVRRPTELPARSPPPKS